MVRLLSSIGGWRVGTALAFVWRCASVALGLPHACAAKRTHVAIAFGAHDGIDRRWSCGMCTNAHHLNAHYVKLSSMHHTYLRHVLVVLHSLRFQVALLVQACCLLLLAGEVQSIE